MSKRSPNQHTVFRKRIGGKRLRRFKKLVNLQKHRIPNFHKAPVALSKRLELDRARNSHGTVDALDLQLHPRRQGKRLPFKWFERNPLFDKKGLPPARPQARHFHDI